MKRERVPVIIVTLSRCEHLIRCIESLKRNKVAVETELYIGLDFPPNEKYMEGYKKIDRYLSELKGFKEIHIIRHNVNMGCEKNHLCVRSKVYEKFDRYIFSEDDNEFSENYLEYMNLLMDLYGNIPDVLAVSGYGYPMVCDYNENHVFFVNTYFSAYGCGTWKSKWEKLEQGIQLQIFKQYYGDKKKMMELRRRSPNQFCYFVKGMIGYVTELRDDSQLACIDLSYGLYMYFNNLKMIFPTITKVKNWGFDGSGQHCVEQKSVNGLEGKTHRDYNFFKQELDAESEFRQITFGEELDEEKVDELLKNFFEVTKREFLVATVAYFVSLILGVDRMYAFVRKIRNRGK